MLAGEETVAVRVTEFVFSTGFREDTSETVGCALVTVNAALALTDL